VRRARPADDVEIPQAIPATTAALPPLPYEYDALDPYIDEETMRLHHDKHHQAYVTNAHNVLEGTEWADRPVEEVLQNLDQISDEKRNAVRNNTGGHYNHSLFWAWMSPDGGGEPDGELRGALDRAFGSRADFKAKLKAAGAGQFGSGWAFLVPDGSSLAVISTPNRTARSRTARRRCWASTSGSTPTTSRTRTGGPTTSTPGGTSSTGQRWRRATPPSQRP